MSPERRNYARRTLYSPEYLDMGADNGGVVVNLSEGGLGFQAVGPVEPMSDIPLSFSLGPGYRIEVKARVVWVSTQGKLGGAVFGKLSRDSRSLIREWLLKPDLDQEETGAATVEAEDKIHLPVTLPSVKSPQTPAIPAQDSKPNAASESLAGQPAAASFAELAARNGVVLPPNDARAPAQSSQIASEPAPPAIAAAPPSSIQTDASEPNSSQPETMPAPASQGPAPPASVAEPPKAIPAAATPKSREIPASAERPRAAALPSQFTERKQERPAGKSFSVVPSISAWSRNEAPATSDTPAAPAGTLFPPRSAENIFARPGGEPSRSEPEDGQRKGSILLIIAAIVIAGGAIATMYVRTHRQQVGTAIVRIGNSIAGEPTANGTTALPPAKPANARPANTTAIAGSNTSTGTPASPLGAKSASTATATAGQVNQTKTVSPLPPAVSAKAPAIPAQSNPNASSPGKATAGVPTKGQSTGQSVQVPSPSTATAAPAPASPSGGQAEYRRAESYLNGKGVAQDPSQAAEWFWRSLEAGDTDAAVPLADLYLQGNGVSRSCTQAHILLDAAARKNNALAIQKLAQLPESCQ